MGKIKSAEDAFIVRINTLQALSSQEGKEPDAEMLRKNFEFAIGDYLNAFKGSNGVLNIIQHIPFLKYVFKGSDGVLNQEKIQKSILSILARTISQQTRDKRVMSQLSNRKLFTSVIDGNIDLAPEMRDKILTLPNVMILSVNELTRRVYGQEKSFFAIQSIQEDELARLSTLMGEELYPRLPTFLTPHNDPSALSKYNFRIN